ncbi:unnamed protein product [Phytophthora fragariaefolia]|uniref:Unnamed protein product n=1 Tax=Phytophthora fragariaefolia TaxID=1490495 RepID=A0A9W6XUE4_9STRA|nr:unnamed protein product [Phytophthora fragariaefolia]
MCAVSTREASLDDDARGQGYDEEDEDNEEKEEVDVEDVKSTAELLCEVEELSLQVSRMGNPRPVDRNLVAELDASADDDDDEDDQGVVQGEWMMMFAPVAMAQAKWSVLGPELTQPINSTGIDQLVEDTVLLLKVMGYRCNSRSNSLILSGWSLARASAELTQWKRRLRAEFGLEKAPGARQTIMDRVAEFTQLVADPSRVPLPKTPETKRPAKGERFQSTVGTPDFEDSHMLTPKKGKPRGGRYDHLYDASDEAELGDSRDDSADLRGDRDETAKDQIRRLSYDEAERDSSQYLELRTHFSLDKVAEFEGRRYRADASLQWLKRFIYEMKGTHMPQNTWCEPFSLSLGRTAKSCRYYSARRKENEPIYDFLIRLNGYARTAKIQYEKGGADAADHVEQFLLNCGDDDIMDLLYPLQLADIQRVEQIINKKILGEKRKKQRDRLVASRVGETHRNDGPQRRDTTGAAVVMITVSAESLWPMQQSTTCTVGVSRANLVGAATRAIRLAALALTDSAVTVVRTQTTAGIMWMLEQSAIGPLGTATRLQVVATAAITAQLAEMLEASTNAPTSEIADTAELTTVRGVPMIAENDAVTRLSDPAMALVQHAEAAGTQHTSAIGGANSTSRCMMRGAARCSSAWRSSPSSSAPLSTS